MSEFTTNEVARRPKIRIQYAELVAKSLAYQLEIKKLREELQELKDNPVRQTSQLEEAILLIPAIQSLLTPNLRFFSGLTGERLREMIKDEIENAIDLQAEDFEEEVKKVVRDMTFELSSTEVEVY